MIPEISLLVDNTTKNGTNYGNDLWRKKFSNKFDASNNNKSSFPQQNFVTNAYQYTMPVSSKDLELSLCIANKPNPSTSANYVIETFQGQQQIRPNITNNSPTTAANHISSHVQKNNGTTKIESKTLKDIYDELLRQKKLPQQHVASAENELNCNDLYSMLTDTQKQNSNSLKVSGVDKSIQTNFHDFKHMKTLHQLPDNIIDLLENFKKTQEKTLNKMRQQVYRHISAINEMNCQTQSLIDFVLTNSQHTSTQSMPQSNGGFISISEESDENDDENVIAEDEFVEPIKSQLKSSNSTCNSCCNGGILKTSKIIPTTMTSISNKKVIICPPKLQPNLNCGPINRSPSFGNKKQIAHHEKPLIESCCCTHRNEIKQNCARVINSSQNHCNNSPSDIVMVQKSVAWKFQDQTPRRHCTPSNKQHSHPVQQLNLQTDTNNCQTNQQQIGNTFYGNILGQVNEVLRNSPSSQTPPTATSHNNYAVEQQQHNISEMNLNER